MSLQETIKHRVSTAKFTTEWVNPERIIDLLDIAVYAPNHKMRQPWRFIILEGMGKNKLINTYLSMIKDVDKENEKNMIMKVFSAPLVLGVIMKKNPVFTDELEDLQATAALIQNMLLLLEDHKMGSFWKTPKYMETDKFKDALGLGFDEIVVALIMIGYPMVKIEPKPRKQARLLTTIYE